MCHCYCLVHRRTESKDQNRQVYVARWGPHAGRTRARPSVDAMTDRYDADQLERDLNATVVMYRQWLAHRDDWTGFDDDERQARLRKLTSEVAEVVEELSPGLEQETEPAQQASEPVQDEFAGKVARGDGTSFETDAYFEEGQLIVADDDDEEWVVDLDDISQHRTSPGILFPDNDGSLLRFVPTDPDTFSAALEEAQVG